MLKAHFEKTGEKLSFTAYIVYCLAQVIREHPHLNSFIPSNRLITLADVTISVLVEREYFIPGFLLKTFIRIADRNMRLAKQYGKVAVTTVGMFSREPVWFIPHGSGTVLITVGSQCSRGFLHH